jgi:aspartyl-tRNA synthetase
VIEYILTKVFKQNTDWKVDEGPFIRIPYKEAMEKYGSDKPDLRNPLTISDLTEIFEGIEFNAFKDKTVKAIKVENNDITVKDYNVIKSSFLPFEYKYFDASNLFNLETQIKVNVSQKLKYNQLIEYQSFEKTLEAFKKHITKFGIDSNNEELILFLYKKYSVQYDSVPVGVFATGNDKAYKMTYIFNLL